MKKRKFWPTLLRSQIFLCLLVTNIQAHVLKIDNPNFSPEERQFFVRTGCSFSLREVEYESSKILVDQQDYEMLDCTAFLSYSPIDRLSVGANIIYGAEQKYHLKYGPASSVTDGTDYSSSASGFVDPEVFINYEFRSRIDEWNQQIFITGNPFDIREEPRKLFRGGNDLKIEYRFSHVLPRDTTYGALFSHYFGKKNFYLPGDTRLSVREGYTEVGLRLGHILRFHERWSFLAEGTFGLSSDYTIRTPEIDRNADKGFMVAFKTSFFFYIDKDFTTELGISRGSRIYNATYESLDREIDYEIEDESYFLNLSYRFGGMK